MDVDDRVADPETVADGVFADFDIGSSPTANTAGSDESRRFTWMQF